jgi:chromosome segregation ATPase
LFAIPSLDVNIDDENALIIVKQGGSTSLTEATPMERRRMTRYSARA